MLRVGEHKVEFITARVIEGRYVLYSNKDASEAWVEVYDPDLSKITEAKGTTHAIPENTTPTERDWNKTVRAWAGFNKVGIWRFVFWARDDFPDADKAHRRKICLPVNRERLKGWILSYGYRYMDGLDTTRLADAVAGAVSNIKVGSEARPGYERVNSNASDPLSVAKEIGEVGAVRRDTKKVPGLIHFAGHSSLFEFDHQQRRWIIRFTNALMFPNWDSCGHQWLGILQRGYEHHIHDVETIRQFAKGDIKPLKNVRVVLLFGCITGPSLSQKFVDLGAKTAVGTKKAMYGPTITDPALGGYYGLFPFIFWRSLALGDSVYRAINRGVKNVNKTLERRGVSRFFELCVSDFSIAGDWNTFIIY